MDGKRTRPDERARTLAVMAGAPVSSVIVDDNEVSQWFGEYADAFVACGRDESGPASLLATTAFRCCSALTTGFSR